MNLPTRCFWLGSARMFAARKLPYESSCASTEPTSSQLERGRQLGVRRFGSGGQQAALTAQRDARSRRTAGARARGRTATACRPRPRTARRRRRAGRCLRSRASGRTGPKRPLPDERAACRCAPCNSETSAIEQRDEQHRVAVEQLVDERFGDRSATRAATDDGEDGAQDCRPLHERAAADALRAPVRERAARPPVRAAGRSRARRRRRSPRGR